MNRMRLTKSKTNSRRSHHGLTSPAQTKEGKTVRLRHRASRKTGMYRDRKVMDVKQSNKRNDQSAAVKKSTDEKKTVEHVEAPK